MKTKDFTRIDNDISKLPLIEDGIMHRILSNSDDYIIHKHQIQKNSGVPENKFNTAWKNLIEKGYIIPERTQGGYKYTIVESPQMVRVQPVNNSTDGTGTTCGGTSLITTNKKTTNIPDQQVNGASSQINLKRSAGEPARQDEIKHPVEDFKWEKTQMERKISKRKILSREILNLECMRIYKESFPEVEAEFIEYGNRMLKCRLSEYDKKTIHPKILKVIQVENEINDLFEQIYGKVEEETK